MLVFGGNTHNDTSYSQGARCYSQSFLAYDPACDRWHTLRSPEHFPHDLSRYGHSAATYADSMYIVGGYNGRTFSDVIRFTPGRCRGYGSRKSCLAAASATIGIKCTWNRKARLCEPFSQATSKVRRGGYGWGDRLCVLAMTWCGIGKRIELSELLINE